MVESIADALSVSTTVIWGLFVLLTVQVAVQFWALVDLARRPRVRFGMKWIWALVIIFLGNSFIGPILYVAIGRNVPEEIDVKVSPSRTTSGERTRRAVDALYGDGEGR
ncbi:MAG: PLDc_N domain-containing protein [Coriobacteriia bacterium]|nr:PLDc_N domain-containing protein [Coriobacteriia bacterium]